MQPDDFDFSALPALPIDMRFLFPHVPCVYFALDGSGKILYIGRAENFYRRWINHHRYRQLMSMGSIKIAWFTCPFVMALPELERSLILHYAPSLNGQKVPEEFKSESVDESERLKDYTPHFALLGTGWIFSADGYVDATHICQRNNKRVGAYLGLKATQKYLESCAQKTGMSVNSLVRHGGHGAGDHTWVHLVVALNLAEWAKDEGLLILDLNWRNYKARGVSVIPS